MRKIYASVNRVSICSNNGLSPIRRQAIILTNAGLLSIEPLGTNFIEIWIKIQIFSFTKVHLKISSAKWRPFCPGGGWVKCREPISHYFIEISIPHNIHSNLHLLHHWSLQHTHGYILTDADRMKRRW